MKMKYTVLTIVMLTMLLTSCEREPTLYLYDDGTGEGEAIIDLPDHPVIDLELDVYWDYLLSYDILYDWRSEWFYGWDDKDRELFGEIGYTEPDVFCLRRYYTGDKPYASHYSVLPNTIKGKTFQGKFQWGFWDILVWNDIITLDGVQSLIFDEEKTLDYVTAYTNMTMHSSRYQAPRYARSFYEPEALFAAYDQAIEINKNLDGFVYDKERNVWVRKLNMVLKPITYIYLTQVILHNNRNRIVAIDGSSDLSGMARSVTVNNGMAGSDAITVYYNSRFKPGCDKNGETVDIIGGRLMTFGLCNHNGNLIKNADEVKDKERHYMDVTMQFNNGMDSTFVFDVTQQVRQRYKGGVLTVELDMDTIPIPTRRGGSGFNAVVVDTEDGGTYEFDM